MLDLELNVTSCIDCLQDETNPVSSDTDTAFDEATGITCSPDPDTNAILGKCKDDCGGLTCLPELQTMLLCVGGSYHVASSGSGSGSDRTTVYGGAINRDSNSGFTCPELN